MKIQGLRLFFLVSVLCLIVLPPATAQSPQCSGTTVTHQPDNSYTIDTGYCFIFDTGPSTTTYQFFGELSGGSYVAHSVSVAYETPDPFALVLAPRLCSSDCSLLDTLTPISGNGSESAGNVSFLSGIYAGVNITATVSDPNSECTVFGYYCYWRAVVTVR